MNKLDSKYLVFHFIPYKFKKIKKYTDQEDIVILDVGCGNNSPSKTKICLPNSIYHGIDKEKYNLNQNDINAMDKFYAVDLNKSTLDEINNKYYDLIVFSHVIEHLYSGELILKLLIQKLVPGGLIYIETPSEKSLSLPYGKGTLNFFDDKTHVKLYRSDLIEEILVKNGVKILEKGIKRDWRQILISPIYLPLQVYTLIVENRLHARGLWDILGFSYYSLGRLEKE